MNFERTLRAYADVEGGEDPFDAGDYVVPTRWTAYHVAKRLLDAYRAVEVSTRVPAPKAFGAAWPEMRREWADLLDADARRNHAADFESTVARARARPNSIEIEKAEEAILWPATFLDPDSPECDALNLWTLASATGRDVSKVLAKRRARADAMIEAIALSMGQPEAVVRDKKRLEGAVAGVLLTANRMLDAARAAAREARSDRTLAKAREDAVFAREFALDRLKRQVRIEALIARPVGQRLRRVDVMPGKVFTQRPYDEKRVAGAQLIADALERRGIKVR